MNRRSTLLLVALAGLAGCSAPGVAVSAASPSSSVAPDFGWVERDPALASGFCFTLVQGLTPVEVAERLGGTELERVEWVRLVSGGDGEQAGTDRYFIGVARIGDWSLIVEDNGALGVAQKVISPLSAGRTVLVYRSDAAGRGRLLALRDEELALDYDSGAPGTTTGTGLAEFQPALRAVGLVGDATVTSAVTEPTVPALEFLAEQTGVPLTRAQLTERTYLLVTVPKT
ncbi:DUF6461 domain-containing protein [Actinoplanes sp. NBC_00393]|uniref:DUF6461 domain-containing protein n=1 Tax=Actinoplanes sp. NBC_00393 TaxID=2975953 RepID=UPI002E1E2176